MSGAENNAVFISYASQDAEAARRICEALRAAGAEVWLDQDGGLVGGDAWDAKIRKQIKECALFLPVISVNTEARLEGYFRLEWKLAEDRSHLMAKGRPFIVPVVVDATSDRAARVPDSFLAIQWTRLPAGETNAAFCARVQSLLVGDDGSDAALSRPVRDPEFVERVRRPSSGAALNQEPGRLGETSPPRRRNAMIAAAVAVFAALIALAILQSWRTSRSGATPKTKPAPTDVLPNDKSVAVLPFANRSGDPQQEYFSDGLTEEILGALRRERDLMVPGNTSCFAFKGRNVPAVEIAQALNVARLVEGSVQRDGSRVRIRITLSRPGNNSSEELGTFTEELTDIFALQEKVARAVVAKLTHRATTAPVAVATRNLAAYDAFLRGRALQAGSQNASGYREIIKLYREAVRLDPDFAPAWARLAQALSWMTAGGFDRSAEPKAEATTAAAAALRLAPQLPEALLAVAIVRLQVDRDLEAAQRALDELERLAPNTAEAWVVRADLERDRGNWGESLIRIVAHAVELDPQSTASLNRLANILSGIGQFAEADRLTRRSWELSQSSTTAIRRRSLNYVAWTGDARTALEMLNPFPPEMLLFEARARLHAKLGETAAAVENFELAKNRAAQIRAATSGPRGGDMMSSYQLGLLEKSRGQPERAAKHFEESLRLAQSYRADFPDLPSGPEYVALTLAVQGQRDAALAAFNDAMALVTRTRDANQIANMRTAKAEMLVLLGDHAAAMAELRAVHDLGRGFGFTLRLEAAWEPLRGNAKFQELMKEAEARANAQPRPHK